MFRMKGRLAVILSILARTCDSQKRKAKPVGNKPKVAKKSKNVVLGYKKGSKFDSDFIFSFSGSLRSYNIPLRVISHEGGPPHTSNTSNSHLSELHHYMKSNRKHVIRCVGGGGASISQITHRATLYVRNEPLSKNIKSDS